MAWKLAGRIATLGALMLALGAGDSQAQEQTFTSVAGAWWFRVVGEDAGALLVAFGAPVAATFPVEDIPLTASPSFGFSRGIAAFFVIDAGQELAFDSKGNVVGTLALSDPNSAASVGSLVIERGTLNRTFTRLKLAGTIQGVGGEPIRTILYGRRVPATFPVLTGRNPLGKLRAKSVNSSAFELVVRSSEVLGLPAYTFDGNGPAEIDGTEVPDVSMAGTVMLAPDRHVYGLLEDSSDFGTGSLSGTLRVPDGTEIPNLKLEARADRTVTARGNLTEPNAPVLAVTPTTLDFGAVRLDATPPTHDFTLTNVGIGELSGEAGFQSGSSSDFSIVGPATFGPLTESDPAAQITVRFAPQTAGVKTAQILFGVAGGAGSKLVTVTGTGGVPAISVVPEALLFGNVGVLRSKVLSFTLTNTGDGPLTGSATITAGASDFALVLTDAGAAVPSIPYTLAPQGQLVIRVRFAPITTGQKTGTLNLTGGAGAQHTVTGTGTTN